MSQVLEMFAHPMPVFAVDIHPFGSSIIPLPLVLVLKIGAVATLVPRKNWC
jgi:hypothetical protein